MTPAFYSNAKEFDYAISQSLFDDIMLGIFSSDIVIADVSERSMSNGYQLSYAIEKKKPLLILVNTRSKYAKNKLFFEDSKRIFFTKKVYDSQSTIRVAIENFIKNNSDSKNERFNLKLTKLQATYLNWISLNNESTKTAIIHNALDYLIERDRDFQKYLLKSNT